MSKTLKQRIVGIVFIISLALILLPVFLQKTQSSHSSPIRLADKPDAPPALDPKPLLDIEYVFTETQEEILPENRESLFNLRDEMNQLDAWFLEFGQDFLKPTEKPLSEGDASVPAVLEPNPAPRLGLENKPVIKSPPPPPSTLKQAVGQTHNSRWTIQVGAFSDKKNAQVLVQKLLKDGFQAYTTTHKADSWIRVYVAPGIHKETAEDLLAQLSKKADVKGIVVRFSEEPSR